MIYFYVKRYPSAIVWDEITFPKARATAAQRFWVSALLHGYLIERVG